MYAKLLHGDSGVRWPGCDLIGLSRNSMKPLKFNKRVFYLQRNTLQKGQAFCFCHRFLPASCSQNVTHFSTWCSGGILAFKKRKINKGQRGDVASRKILLRPYRTLAQLPLSALVCSAGVSLSKLFSACSALTRQ